MTTLAVLFSFFIQAPPDTARIIDTVSTVHADTLFTIKKQHDFFYADKLDNVYVIYKDVITRYQSKGDSLLQQSFKKYGDVETFDGTQALRPVIFYPSQSLVITTDNTLSLQNEAIELSEWGFEQITLLAASSFNDGFWLFDNGSLELLRVDHTFKIINRSGNLSTALVQAPQPKSMKEYNNRLYMHIPGTGIAVFDQYANYLKTLPINSLTNFDVYGDYIYYVLNGDLYQYDMLDFTTGQVTTGASLQWFAVSGNRLYLGNSKTITVVGFN
jgi:hypothetical protein